MIKELKYLFIIIIVTLFFFITFNYYFSDMNKKNSYRLLKLNDDKLTDYSKKIILLGSDTDNIVEYNKKTVDKNKKKYNFWKLIDNNE